MSVFGIFGGGSGPVQMKFRGMRAMERELKKIADVVDPRGKRLAGGVVRTAIKAATAPVLKAAKKLIAGKKHTGNLWRSLAVSRGRRIRRYARMLVAVIGPNWPMGAHAHLIERGTRNRKTSKGENRGRMPKFPFLNPAFREKRAASQRIMAERIRVGIEKAWARLAAKTNKGR